MNERKVIDIYWGILFAVAGGLLLADNLGVIKLGFDWKTHWPLLLIAFGGSMIIRAFGRRRE